MKLKCKDCGKEFETSKKTSSCGSCRRLRYKFYVMRREQIQLGTFPLSDGRIRWQDYIGQSPAWLRKPPEKFRKEPIDYSPPPPPKSDGRIEAGKRRKQKTADRNEKMRQMVRDGVEKKEVARRFGLSISRTRNITLGVEVRSVKDA